MQAKQNIVKKPYQNIQHRGGRFTPLWDGTKFIDAVTECIYIILVQMDIENFGIIVIADRIE